MTRDPKLGEAPTVDASEAASTPALPTGERTPAGTTSPSSRGTLMVGPGASLGRYQIGEEIGAGGMATVYSARDPQLRRDVAIKVMFPHLAKKPDVSRRFQREARAAAGLEHANILRVYDVGGGRVADGAPDEPPYIVMELVRGQSLRELGDAVGPMMAEVVACIGAVLCDALAVAHAAGVIHRDVKPGNVMATDDGRLLLADFGVAHVADDDSLVTRTGALLGTPSYMSPEQAHGADVDGRSDLYSVGATLYQLATGSAPFSGSTAVIVAAIVRGDYTPPLRRRPQIGTDLSRAILQLMAKEPSARPPDAAAAAAMLRAIAKDCGFGEPRDELIAYLKDPAGFEAARRPVVIARLVERARQAFADRAIPRAIALVDRILAIEPDHVEGKALAERISRGDRRRRIGVIALLGGCAAALGTGVVLLATQRGPAAAATPDAGAIATVGQVADATPVLDAAPPPDAVIAMAAPIDAGRVRALAIDGGVRARPIDAAEAVAIVIDAAPPLPAPIDAAPPPAQGTISIALDGWCDLSIDGASLGRADRKKKYPVDAGKHRIVCTQGKGLARFEGSVTVAAGGHETVTGSIFAKVHVTIAVSDGDAVRIDGTRYGNGKTVDLKPGRLRVEVLSGSTVVATEHIDLPRVASCTIKDRPDVECYP